jgi:hypothetical protein
MEWGLPADEGIEKIDPFAKNCSVKIIKIFSK